ncbi:MAG: MFS transporter [Alphaproteobacteria bacterium]|nr:MFS transporter [Alphaproteobacteria bacterium]
MTVATTTCESLSMPQEGSYLKRVILSCMVGNALEWYDFALYGYFATTIGSLFFPKISTFAALMATFGIFAAGFIMRPLGGIIFGHIGDKIGRKNALLWSIYLMAIPTTLIGLLPTYEQIGWLAPLLLTLIRLAQGLSMGGEFTGSMIFVVEHSQTGNRGLYGSWVVFSLLIGILVGSGVATITCYSLTDDQLLGWGWRIPFLLSIAGGFVGSVMRKTVNEPEQFSKAKELHKEHSTPLIELFKNHLRTIAYVVTIELTLSVGFYLIVTFINNYLTALLEFDMGTSLMMTTISMGAMGVAIPLSGWLSDRIGRKPVLISSALAFTFFAYPLFVALEGSFTSALSAQIGLSFIMGMFFAPIPATLVELFPLTVRFSGLSIAHSISMAVFGGSAPLIATGLIQLTGNNAAPAIYLGGTSLIAAIALFFMKDRFRSELT